MSTCVHLRNLGSVKGKVPTLGFKILREVQRLMHSKSVLIYVCSILYKKITGPEPFSYD